MYVAVLKYLYKEDKPIGIPDEWPAEIIELGESTTLPGLDWVLMTYQELTDHKTVYQSDYDLWSVNLNLDELKIKKNKIIDMRTEEIIAQGFIFDSHTFSLSIPAQINWAGLLTFENLLTWPMTVTTIDDNEYVLNQSDLLYFLGTGTSHISTTIASGRNLKLLVNAVTTKAELDAIIDSR